jgi:hypothetical protein
MRGVKQIPAQPKWICLCEKDFNDCDRQWYSAQPVSRDGLIKDLELVS